LRDKVRATVAVTVLALSVLGTSSAFIFLYGQVFQPSPLLNTNMQYWTIDPTKNLTTPYLWTIDLIKGPTDNVSVYKAVVAGRSAIALRVERINPNNSQIWTTVHVRQDLRGQALGLIFDSNISLDVFPTFQYLYDANTKNPENTFGVEINDGTNLLWYVFADEPSETVQLPHHRIILTQTPLNVWSTREINIASEYAAAGWKKPVSISFTLILGTTWLHLGNWVGYFCDLSVAVPTLQTQAISRSQTVTVLSADVLVIIFLAGGLAVYRSRKALEEAGTRKRVKVNVE
jgi:hypothetical protein